MGYRNDQYFNLNKSGESIGSQTQTASGWNIRANNPKFLYPDRSIRTNDNEGTKTEYLKRGYIRSIPFTNVDTTDFTVRKCQFQFNPTSIQQSVSQNTSYRNFLLQNPEDMAQPMASSVNFTFSLLFDRSMELNNPSLGFDKLNEVNPWELSDPSQVGVLADMSAFFSVIGQGLSESQLKYVTDVFEQRATSTPEGVRYQGGGGTSALPTLANGTPDLNVNIGNSALLLPLPVRVVFSSLYIVEGFVNNTSVAFTKFNTNMVPMQCYLTVTMEAKYIGFAKKDTYLTFSLAEAAAASNEVLNEETTRVQGFQSALQKVAGQIEMKLTDSVPGVYWPAEHTNSEVAVDLIDGDGDFYFYARLPNVDKDVEDEIVTLMDDGSSVSINMYPKITLYKAPSSVGSLSLTQSELVRYCRPDSIVLDASMAGWPSAAYDKSTWYKHTRAAHTEKIKNTTSLGTGSNSEKLAQVNQMYFIARYEATIIAVIDGVVLTGLAERYKLFRPGELYEGPGGGDPNGLLQRMQVVWPQTQAVVDSSGSNVGSVPPTNTATDTPSAGRVSKVGTVPKKTSTTIVAV